MRSPNSFSCSDSSLTLNDLENIQNQLIYKDNRICELSGAVVRNEQDILELKELCSEKDLLITAKNEALELLKQKIGLLESKEKREVGTETDFSFFSEPRSKLLKTPGHLVMRGCSPPPLDPSECDGEHALIDHTMIGSEEMSFLRKQKKRVTFDLSFNGPEQTGRGHKEDWAAEKESMRLQFETAVLQWEKEKLELEQCLDMKESSLRDAKQSVLKNRAVSQSRIRELEEKISHLNSDQSEKMNSLKFEIDSLRSARDWEVKRNGFLREEMSDVRTKLSQITDELDGSEKNNRELSRKLKSNQETKEAIVAELLEAESLVVMMEEQKNDILDDVDRLRDALKAQDSLIDLLEADVIIYEEHIGILRESLGASKIDHRAIIRSRAFEAKLNALELEKEQFCRRSHEENVKSSRLKTRIAELEEQNEKLVEKLCEAEMLLRDQHEMERSDVPSIKSSSQKESPIEFERNSFTCDGKNSEIRAKAEDLEEKDSCYTNVSRMDHTAFQICSDSETRDSSADDCLMSTAIDGTHATSSESRISGNDHIEHTTTEVSGETNEELSRLVSENIILRQCVDDSVRTQNVVFEDLEKLCDLKSELETAVNALKGEVWSLNEQLKKSHMECSSLRESKSQLEEDSYKVQEMINALRSDYLAMSSECEKAEKEHREMMNELEKIKKVAEEERLHNEEFKKAYQLLNGYYEDLQSAYNDLYAKHSQFDETGKSATILDNLLEFLQVHNEAETDEHKTEIIFNRLADLRKDIVILNETIEELKLINEALMERIPNNIESQTEDASDSENCIILLKDKVLALELANKKLAEEVEEMKLINETDGQISNRQKVDLDIMKAQLITKQTSISSLIRSNSELTYTNAELQEQLDAMMRETNVANTTVKSSSCNKSETDLGNEKDNTSSLDDLLEEVETKENRNSSSEGTYKNDSTIIQSSDLEVCEALKNASEVLLSGCIVDLSESELENNCGVDKLGLEIKSFIRTCSLYISNLMKENDQLSQKSRTYKFDYEELVNRNKEAEAKIEQLEELLMDFKKKYAVLASSDRMGGTRELDEGIEPRLVHEKYSSTGNISTSQKPFPGNKASISENKTLKHSVSVGINSASAMNEEHKVQNEKCRKRLTASKKS